MARHRRTIKKKMPAKDKSLTAEKNIADYTEKEREGVEARKNRGLFKKISSTECLRDDDDAQYGLDGAYPSPLAVQEGLRIPGRVGA